MVDDSHGRAEATSGKSRYDGRVEILQVTSGMNNEKVLESRVVIIFLTITPYRKAVLWVPSGLF